MVALIGQCGDSESTRDRIRTSITDNNDSSSYQKDIRGNRSRIKRQQSLLFEATDSAVVCSVV